MARPYRSKDHLQAVIASEHGAIWISPQTADRIYFDIAKANHLPENRPDSRNGSTVLNIGRGVSVRASGSIYRREGQWVTDLRDYDVTQYPSGREATAKQHERACELIEELIGEWAKTHEGDIAQADDIERNNAARTLEEAIEQHERALRILKGHLARCESGEAFETYPTLPTGQ